MKFPCSLRVSSSSPEAVVRELIIFGLISCSGGSDDRFPVRGFSAKDNGTILEMLNLSATF